jgi:dihydropteroate synthase
MLFSAEAAAIAWHQRPQLRPHQKDSPMRRQNNWIFRERTLNLGGRLEHFETPRIMGILNATPDSFYRPPGSAPSKASSASGENRIPSAQELVDRAGRMLEDGADWLDLGGMSTRPGAETVSPEAEIERVIPPIQAIHQAFPDTPLSVDTVHARVAREAAAAGAVLINDVSAGRMDEALIDTVAELGLPYVLMHMQGQPRDMQAQPEYADPVQDVYDFLQQGIADCRARGIGDILIDPGFGFGKTLEHNYELLAGMDRLRHLGCAILIGVSRKSMIHKALQSSPEAALNGSTVLHTLALIQGADVLRVHDPREARETIALTRLYLEGLKRSRTLRYPEGKHPADRSFKAPKP